MTNATSQLTGRLNRLDFYLASYMSHTFMSHARAILTDSNCDPGDNSWQAPKDGVYQELFLRWSKANITPAQTDVAAGAPSTTATSVLVLVCQTQPQAAESWRKGPASPVAQIKWGTVFDETFSF